MGGQDGEVDTSHAKNVPEVHFEFPTSSIFLKGGADGNPLSEANGFPAWGLLLNKIFEGGKNSFTPLNKIFEGGKNSFTPGAPKVAYPRPGRQGNGRDAVSLGEGLGR
jgi:hypothetical protein